MRMFVLVIFTLLFSFVVRGDWKVVNTFPIGGSGSWDYITVDEQTHRLFVPRATHTVVIDAGNGKTLGDIPGQVNAHGVAIDPKTQRGFISDGGGNGAIVIFDLKNYAVLGTIATMPDADGIIFDRVNGLVLVVSGRGKTLMTLKPDLDPKAGKIDSPIPLRGEPEFLAADNNGLVYINLMTTNEVAVVNLAKRQVIANWPVAPGGQPVGMAIDATKGRLFIGCRGPQKLIAMDTRDGKVISDVPIGESVDAVKFDRGQVFASTGDSQMTVATEISTGALRSQSVKTGEGARTMGFDSVTHRLYLPSADYAAGSNGKRSPQPGTFKILVVSNEP